MTILFGFLLVVSITGIIGNLIVTSVYINKNDKATSSFFILVLAFSDLVVCSILIPFTIFIEASNFQIESILFCKLYYFITTTIVPNGCFLMVSIAFDRFFCICQGNNNILTLARAKLLVAIIILTSILLGIIPALSAKVESISEEVQAYMSNQSNSTAAPLPEHYSICYIELQSNIGYLSRITKSFLDVIYAIAIVVITILYALIYKGVYTRRKKKRERTHALLMSSYRNGRSMNSHELSRFPHRPSKLLQPSKERPNTAKSRDEEQPILTVKNNINANDNNNNNNGLGDESRLENLVVDFPVVANNSMNNYSYNVKLISTKDIRTAVMLFVVTFLYILFFSPSIIATYYNLLVADTEPNNVDHNEVDTGGVLIFVIYLYYANSALNPLIYCFLNPVFRKDLKKTFFSRDSCYHKLFIRYE